MANRESRAESGNDGELLRLIIDEIDQARDLYELAQQLTPLLPIRSFDELVKGTAGKQLRFRDTGFDVESLRPFVPPVVFPIENARGLVERLAHLIRMVPPELGVDVNSEAGMRRQLRQSGALTPGIGLMSQRKATATVISPGMTGRPRE